jgi:hypothetical protein
VHQMHALHDRRCLHGDFGDHLTHVSYFLSDMTRPRFRSGTFDLVPNHFSGKRSILTDGRGTPLVLAAASMPAPVRLRDDRRRPLLLERRPSRFRPRRDVLAWR